MNRDRQSTLLTVINRSEQALEAFRVKRRTPTEAPEGIILVNLFVNL